MKVAIAKSARAGKQEAITANEDFHESASEDERGERQLTLVQYQKYMKDLENMKAGESLRRFKELHKDQNDGESASSGDENATVWAAEPRRRVVKTTRGHRESAGQRTRRSASVPERSRPPRGESMRASERSRGESVRLTERSPAPGSKSSSRPRRYYLILSYFILHLHLRSSSSVFIFGLILSYLILPHIILSYLILS